MYMGWSDSCEKWRSMDTVQQKTISKIKPATPPQKKGKCIWEPPQAEGIAEHPREPNCFTTFPMQK